MSPTQDSSQALEDRVLTALDDSPYLSRRNFEFQAQDGRVTLRGTVGSYFHKQMAQETLRRLDGVQEIENLLEVNWATRA